MKDEIAKQILIGSVSNYDEIAENFSKTRQKFWAELEFVKNCIKENGKILDVGCGNGRFFEVIKDKKNGYTGVDTSQKLIDIAKEKYPSMDSISLGQSPKFLRANALNLPFQNETFDTVVSFAVLHHIPSKKLREKFMNEIYRVLKKDGVVILSVWNLWQKKYLSLLLKHGALKAVGLSGLDFKDILMGFGGQKNTRYLHAFTKRELKKLTENADFKLKKLELIKRNFLVTAEKIH